MVLDWEFHDWFSSDRGIMIYLQDRKLYTMKRNLHLEVFSCTCYLCFWKVKTIGSGSVVIEALVSCALQIISSGGENGYSITSTFIYIQAKILALICRRKYYSRWPKDCEIFGWPVGWKQSRWTEDNRREFQNLSWYLPQWPQSEIQLHLTMLKRPGMEEHDIWRSWKRYGQMSRW